MKNKGLSLLLSCAIIFVTLHLARGQTPDKLDLQKLVERYLPGCNLQADSSGKPRSLVTATGEVLELAKAAKETPAPTAVVGYWYSPTMDFLSRQNMKINTAQDAEAVTKILHTLWRGAPLVQQKTYAAIPFSAGWVIEVDHDFTKYPGSVQQIMPYELLVDRDHTLTQFRQRCYHYLGSDAVYTNTVISVYEKQKGINGGINYPDVLEKELRKAWESEKERPTNSAPTRSVR